MTWQQLPNGKWVGDLDGVDDYVEVLDDPSLDPDYITIEAYIMLKDPPTRFQVILSKRYADTVKQYVLAGDPTGRKFHLGISIGDTWYDSPETPTLAFDTWYHITGTFDGSKLSIYLNGEFIGATNVSGVIDKTTEPLVIGLNRGYNIYFHGLIAFVRIYNRALSDEEIKQLYDLARRVVPMG